MIQKKKKAMMTRRSKASKNQGKIDEKTNEKI
jgi:hypothetical protein